MDTVEQREAVAPIANPLELEGIEFVEYTTSRPQALGQVLEEMGFRPVARHRSREVLLYRQGDMNVIVNAHDASRVRPGGADDSAPVGVPMIAAIALRVRNAAAAYRHVLERGAWAVPTHVEVMELNIPAIHGVGTSRIYFIDRYREFSIYDVDFTPIPTVDPHPPALTGMHFFGAVQYIDVDRSDDWTEFYAELFGFAAIPDEQRFGVMPKGRVLRSPCGLFMLQLIEPDRDYQFDLDGSEMMQRIGLGTPDVIATVAALKKRGVAFVESAGVQTSPSGAVTQTRLGSVMFELVRSTRGASEDA